MKKFLVPVLALVLSQAPSFAQSQLTLVIDKDAQTLDWLAGTSISTEGSLANNWFGAPFFANTIITSPALNYTGEGSHFSTLFQIGGDNTQITGINLATSLPALSAAVLSGTVEGPATPIFTQGDFSLFNGLTKGEYTLAPMFGNWSGGIQVVVVPEPATWAFLALGLGAVAFVRTRPLRNRR
jgi:PEP-CTERM motif